MARFMRWLVLAGWLGLVLGMLAWHGWWAETPRLWLGAVLAAPLLLPLPGLWRGRGYTYAWTSLLVLVYLTYLLTEFLAGGSPGIVAPALFSAVALFCGCLLYVRGKDGVKS